MATLMLENGADIRFIQEMLGHSHLSSTDVYTHVSIAKLREIHHATYPAELAHRGAAPASPNADARALLEQLADDDQEDDDTPPA